MMKNPNMHPINSPSCIIKDWTRRHWRIPLRPPVQRMSLLEDAPNATNQRSLEEDARGVRRQRTHDRKLLRPMPRAIVAATGATCASRGHLPRLVRPQEQPTYPRLTWPSPSKPLAPRVATVAATTTKADCATANRHRCQNA